MAENFDKWYVFYQHKLLPTEFWIPMGSFTPPAEKDKGKARVFSY